MASLVCATTDVVDINELDSDALSGLAQVLQFEVQLQAVASRTQRRIRPDHVQVIHIPRVNLQEEDHQ